MSNSKRTQLAPRGKQNSLLEQSPHSGSHVLYPEGRQSQADLGHPMDLMHPKAELA